MTMQSKDVPRGLMLHAAFTAQHERERWSCGNGPCPRPWCDDPRLDYVPEKLFWHVAYRMVDDDLLEYGVSLNVPWLTDKGLAALMGYQ